MIKRAKFSQRLNYLAAFASRRAFHHS